MKTVWILLVLCASSWVVTGQQPQPSVKFKFNEKSVVKDSSGTQFPYAIWTKLLATGRYILKADDPTNEKSSFTLVRLTDEQYEKKITSLPKPIESKYFTTGAPLAHFKTKDIEGNKISTKELAGKIIVLNFWFIKCLPCMTEMPELDKLSREFLNDSSVIFIAVALDEKRELKDFLAKHSFGYRVIDDGRFIADQYGIKSYPTNVVINQQGNVYFHTAGLANHTVHWIRKSIEELKSLSKN